MLLFCLLSIVQLFLPSNITRIIPNWTEAQAATSSVSLLISVGRFEVTTLKIVSALWCLRKGSSRANSLLPFETAKKGRNSPPESLLGNMAGKKENYCPYLTNVPMVVSKKMKLLDELAFHVIYISKVLCNSQGLVLLQLWVDVVHFPLTLIHQPLFLCLRQRCGFHPVRLLHLQKNYEQLKSRTPCWEE